MTREVEAARRPALRLPPPPLRCDVPGCSAEIAVKVGAEQRCLCHALERGNQLRAARGLPPIAIDEEGGAHVVQ